MASAPGGHSIYSRSAPMPPLAEIFSEHTTKHKFPMNQKVRLLDNQSQSLVLLPEKGMGYQIVDIELTDGRRLEKIEVIDSTYLVLGENELIDPKDISSIKLHK